VDPTPPPIHVINTTVAVDASPLPKQEPEEETKEIDLGIVQLKRMDSPENLPPVDKPLLSARFTHRKPLKFSPEGTYCIKILFFFSFFKQFFLTNNISLIYFSPLKNFFKYKFIFLTYNIFLIYPLKIFYKQWVFEYFP
jgi:hypothetical protein